MGRWGGLGSSGDQLRYALRRLRGARGYTASAVGILGLGLGVLFAAATLLQKSALEPLPVHDQNGLVVAWANHPARGADHYPVNVQLFEAAEAGGLGALSGVAAVPVSGTRDVVLETDGGPRPVAWANVLGDFFGVLGVPASRGRTLQPSDDVPGPPDQVAVISDGLWDRLYGRSPEAVGAILRTRAGAFRIVGVAPPAFDYPLGAEVWSPTRPAYPSWDSERPRLELDLVGRLEDGASPALVEAQLAQLATSTPALAGIYGGAVPVVRSLEAQVRGHLKPVLWLLFAAGVLVLSVACLDVANLVLVRASADRRRAALQQALGLTRAGLMTEAAVEALILGLGATALAVVISVVGLRVLMPLVPEALIGLQSQGRPGLSTLLPFAILGVVAAVLAIGVPRWIVASAAPEAGAFRSGSPSESPKGRRFREIGVAAQVALAAWVLITGILLVGTVSNLTALDPGFEPDQLAIVQLNRDVRGPLAAPGDASDIARVVADLESKPGVAGVTPVQMAPLPGNGAWRTILFKEGQSNEEALEQNAYVFMEFVEPGFDSVMGMPVVQGRSLAATDDRGGPSVVVVNRAAAELYWPGASAIGQRVTHLLPGLEGEPFAVVGIVENTRYGDLTQFEPTVYFSFRQTGMFGVQHLLIRSDRTAGAIFDAVRSALSANAPQFEAVRVASVEEELDGPLERPRFAAILVMALAATALVLALAGVYGTMTFSVQSRRRELGVRLACGGTPGHVSGLVVRRGLGLAAAGSIAGAMAAAASGRAVETLLFGVEPTSFLPLALGALLASAFTLAACLPAARQAAQTEPALALKSD